MKSGVNVKIKQGFSLKKENGEYAIICDKTIQKDFNSTIFLTGSSVFLWNMLVSGEVNKEQMLNALLENYNISTVLALSNIDIFIKTLKENGILEE